MKLLQLSKKVPHPMKDGESIAVTQSARSLANKGVHMDLLTFNTVKHSCDLAEAREALDHYGRIEAIPLDNRVRPLDALKNLLLTKDSYHIERFVDDAYSAKLIEMLNATDYDIVQLETIYTAPYIPIIRKHSTARIVLRAHNVEHEIWERLARNTRNPLKRAYLRILSDRLRTFEIDQLDLIDAMLSISAKDDENFRSLGFVGNSRVMPISLNLETYIAATEWDAVTLSFIGSLDWYPNIEGLDWFLENVDLNGLTCPRTGQPVKFHVAGRNPPGRIVANSLEALQFHGEVPDAIDFINDHPIMVVPLFSGSGMRTKILEAMALERVVITTSLGLEGIDAIDGEEVLIADSGEAFREKIQWLLKNPAKIAEMGVAARKHIEINYDAATVADDVHDFLNSVIRMDETVAITRVVERS
ncbi:MAG: glycosyltransferase involved in cell wall biosynthesis [Verrucomicrobiales bacterium]|jgi:glycosyltransferase involved in cell wall biosynthesis